MSPFVMDLSSQTRGLSGSLLLFYWILVSAILSTLLPETQGKVLE